MAAPASHTNSPHAPQEKSNNARKFSEKGMNSKKGKAKENSTEPSSKHILVQGVTTSSREVKEVPWKWSSIMSPTASRVSPVFTKDGSYFFSLVGSSVQIRSTATGQIVSTLTVPDDETTSNHQSNSLSCAIINPHNPFQLITGSLNGRLMIWDFLDGTLLRTIDVIQPIHFICAHEQFKDFVFVVVSRLSKQDSSAAVMRVSLQNADTPANSTPLRSAEVLIVGKTRFPTGLAISSNGVWLVATAAHKVYVAKTSALTTGFTKYVSPERLTCLAFHPSEEYFATGDDKGVIRLWYCLNDRLASSAKGVEKRTQTSSMHWHAHAVSALTFTSNGAYLLSGGEEAVLVIWQLHTRRKEFVPRVGSPINTISVARSKTGEEEYLLGLADATYAFINAGSMKISKSFSRIKIDPSVSSPSKVMATPLAAHSLSSTIILPSSHPSSLQIYSLSKSTLVYELEVSPSNRVSRREDKPLGYSRVELCVISPSGDWMATVDRREGDDDFRAEVYLKIWGWDKTKSVWTLNTRIDKPHGYRGIVSITFSQGLNAGLTLQLVSAGEDGSVKVWRLRGQKVKNGERGEFWVARTTLKYRSEKPRFTSWSYDGSLLAVSYESCVMVYETSAYAVLRTVTSPECKSPQSVHFVGGRNLLIGGATRLVLWDVVTHTVLWHLTTKTKNHSVAPHPSGLSFAMFEEQDFGDSRTTRISIFSLRSSHPTKIYTLPFTLLGRVWYSNTTQPFHYSFLGISQSWNFVAFGDSVSLDQEDTSAKELGTDKAVRKPTLLQDIFGASAFIDVTNLHSSGPLQHQAPSSSKSTEEIFGAPAYLTPPLNTFFDSLMHTLLKKWVTEEGLPPSQNMSEMDVDEDEVEEEEPQVATTAPPRTVTSSEINNLVGLFRKHAIRDQPLPQSTKINGKTGSSTPLRQPLRKSLPNGTPYEPKTATIATSDSSDESASPPPLTSGRKRKKP